MIAANRLGAVAGTTVFIIALLAQLARVEPALALLVALGAGTAAGLACYTAASAFALLRPEERVAVRPRPRPAPVAADGEEAEVGGAPAPEPVVGEPAAPGLDRAADLQQTVRLDETGLDAVLGEDLAAELARARAEALTPEAPAPLAEPGGASENEGESRGT